MNFDKYKNTVPYASRHIDLAGWQAYQTEQARIMKEFRQDLFEDLGIEDNPKRDMLFDKAWDRGHSGGYYDVYAVAQDLVDLIL